MYERLLLLLNLLTSIFSVTLLAERRLPTNSPAKTVFSTKDKKKGCHGASSYVEHY